LVRVIERRARRSGKSLNRTIIEALEASLLNRPKKKERRVYQDLDWMVGSWTKGEADEFDRALAEQRTIDPELWKRPGCCSIPLRTRRFVAPTLRS